MIIVKIFSIFIYLFILIYLLNIFLIIIKIIDKYKHKYIIIILFLNSIVIIHFPLFFSLNLSYLKYHQANYF